MSDKFTNGTWKVVLDPAGYPNIESFIDDDTSIVIVGDEGFFSDGMHDDATLMSASKHLLEALEGIIRNLPYDAYEDPSENTETINKALAAIAKARGKAWI